MKTRLVLGGLGVLLAAYGAYRLASRQDAGAWIEAGAWLAVGVLLHDGLAAPLSILGGAVLVRWVPPAARPPAAVGAIVLGSVTLLAVPVLGRFGARPDNQTLLDRPYWTGWVAVAGLLAVGVGIATLLRARRNEAGEGVDDGAGARR